MYRLLFFVALGLLWLFFAVSVYPTLKAACCLPYKKNYGCWHFQRMGVIGSVIVILGVLAVAPLLLYAKLGSLKQQNLFLHVTELYSEAVRQQDVLHLPESSVRRLKTVVELYPKLTHRLSEGQHPCV